MITSGSDYQSGNLTILVMWDEGYGANNPAGESTPSNPPLFIISPYVTPGATDTNGAVYSAASVTRAVEDIAGTPRLRGGQQPLTFESRSTSRPMHSALPTRLRNVAAGVRGSNRQPADSGPVAEQCRAS